jgi:hypothetical protein
MTSTSIFCSYPRARADDVGRIAANLEQLGQEVWLDRALSGGQEWWDTILDRIRSSGCFVFLVCEEALQSRACRAELNYALATHRTILPVAVGPAVPDAVLPRSLSRLQRIDGSDPMQIARAVVNLPPAPPVPSPLPPPPPVPISYLDEKAAVLERPELSLTEQRDFVGALRERLARGEDVPAAVTLLRRLRQRSDLYAGVAADVDALLEAHDGPGLSNGGPSGQAEMPGPGTAQAPPTPWWPAPPHAAHAEAPAPSRRSGAKVAALVGGGLLVVAVGVASVVALGGGDDDTAAGTGSRDVPAETDPTDPPGEAPSAGDDTSINTIPVDETEELPDSYGDNSYLDGLSEDCLNGDLVACDDLWSDSPVDSDYEAFANTCGARVMLPFEGSCNYEFVEGYSDDVMDCDAGDMTACDFLYEDSAVGSLYEIFGATCGLRTDELVNGACAVSYST